MFHSKVKHASEGKDTKNTYFSATFRRMHIYDAVKKKEGGKKVPKKAERVTAYIFMASRGVIQNESNSQKKQRENPNQNMNYSEPFLSGGSPSQCLKNPPL